MDKHARREHESQELKKSRMRIAAGMAGLVVVILALFLFHSRTTKKSDTTTSTANQYSVHDIEVSAEQYHTKCEAVVADLEKFSCYKQAFQTYMSSQDKANAGRNTMNLLDDMQKLGGYALSECHPLAHKVGNIAFTVYGSVLAAVPQYVPVCASGYYHGLLEQYLSQAPDYDEGIKTVCGSVTGGGDPGYFNWFQCTHGLGHGVMEHDADDVPRSLKDCDKIDPKNQGQEICYAGVFMENITTDAKTGNASKFIKTDDPIYPCDFVDVKYKSSCYFLSSSQILKINGWNFQDAFNVCDTKAEKPYRWLCYESMGRDVSGSSLENPSRVIELCNLGAIDMRGECYFGAVRDFTNNQGTFDKSIALCNQIPTDYTAKCYQAIQLDLGLYKTGADYLKICAMEPEPYKTQCDQQVKY